MDERHSKYIPMDNLKDGSTHLEVSICYCKDARPRGYYMTVTPVKKANNATSFALFTSKRALIATTNRYSDKQFCAAVDNSAALEKMLTEQVLAENQISDRQTA